jgi:hypothetical protein
LPKYFLNFIGTYAMFGLDFINEPLFPNDLLQLHQVYQIKFFPGHFKQYQWVSDKTPKAI